MPALRHDLNCEPILRQDRPAASRRRKPKRYNPEHCPQTHRRYVQNTRESALATKCRNGVHAATHCCVMLCTVLVLRRFNGVPAIMFAGPHGGKMITADTFGPARPSPRVGSEGP
jgi:hypothetical protein